MQLSSVNKRYTASVRGLVTEGNELSAVEHSNLDESNYELLHDGTRRRRRPVLQEKSNPTEYRPLETGNAVSSFLWETPAREENISIVAEEVEGHIRFYWLEHEALTHISEDLLDDELALNLFGRYNSDGQFSTTKVDQFDYTKPSTYTEGNGSLYIFNQFSGTIKVDLVDRDTRELRFTPIGTWIRDYQGADEHIDLYERVPFSNGVPTLFNGVGPVNNEVETWVRETLPNNRGYNLSNQGWSDAGLNDFVEQSSFPYEYFLPGQPAAPTVIPAADRVYPSYMDRFLDGRSITDDNEVNAFSYVRVVTAPERTSEPTKGARIGHSDYHPAGSVQPVPVNRLNDSRIINTTVPLNDSILFEVTFDQPITHSLGREDRNMAMFIHYMTMEVTRISDNKTFTAGFTGVVDITNISADGLTATGFIENANFNDYDNFVLTGMFVHPSPTYTPHKLTDEDDTASYDYRNERRPQAGAFYAGRLWQFGDEHNRLYFSQLIPESTHGRVDADIQRESMCYTANSPTDGDDSATVATDGGYVVVSDSGTHLQGEVLLGSLIVTTDNGIWEIKGNDRSGMFLPDGFVVRRLTSSEVLGHKAMVNLGQEIHVATDEGIIRIFPDERTGVLKPENMTNATIKSAYDKLADEDRYVVGAYDPDSRTVRWAFPLKETYTSNFTESACPMLSYSMQHASWYKYDFGFGAAIADMIVLPYTVKNPTYNRFRYLIVALNLTGIPAPLTVEWGIEAEIGSTGINEWVEFHDPDAVFADFMDVFIDPQERTAPEAFMLTHHHLYGDGMRWQHINYVTIYNRDVTTHWIVNADSTYDANIDGSTLLQAQWDWFTGDGRGKHTAPQETYRYRRSYFADTDVRFSNPEQDRREDLIVAKQKVRGKGREFRLRWSSNDHYDSHIVGWSVEGLVSTTL